MGVAVFSFRCTAFTLEWFRGRGLCHSAEGDAWQEYDGNTAHLPDTNLHAVGVWEGLPTVDLGRARSNGWRDGQGDGGLKEGHGEYLKFNVTWHGGLDFRKCGLWGY